MALGGAGGHGWAAYYTDYNGTAGSCTISFSTGFGNGGDGGGGGSGGAGGAVRAAVLLSLTADRCLSSEATSAVTMPSGVMAAMQAMEATAELEVGSGPHHGQGPRRRVALGPSAADGEVGEAGAVAGGEGGEGSGGGICVDNGGSLSLFGAAVSSDSAIGGSGGNGGNGGNGANGGNAGSYRGATRRGG